MFISAVTPSSKGQSSAVFAFHSVSNLDELNGISHHQVGFPFHYTEPKDGKQEFRLPVCGAHEEMEKNQTSLPRKWDRAMWKGCQPSIHPSSTPYEQNCGYNDFH
jgi:hypothetical protein